jgi:processing peptidase subunit alpha
MSVLRHLFKHNPARLPRSTRVAPASTKVNTDSSVGKAVNRFLEDFVYPRPPTKPLWDPLDISVDYSHISNPLAPSIFTSTLPNGLRLVSIDSLSPITGLGVLADFGSRYEVNETAGVAKVLEKQIYQSNESMTQPQLVREIQAAGGNITSSASRDSIYYAGEVLRDSAPVLFDILGSGILRNKFDQWEVNDSIRSVLAPFENGTSPPPDIMDLSMQCAFAGETLGRSMLPTPPQLLSQNITPKLLQQVVSTYFQPNRIVLAAAGISHEDFLALARKSVFGQMPASSASIVRPPARYVGGDLREHTATEDGLTHVAISFPSVGILSRDLVPTVMLQILLGGGSSFSSGGPGKGMHSRLYRHVLNQYGFVHGIQAYTALCDDISLFGLMGSTTPEYTGQLIEVIVKELKGMHSVTSEELSRAKNQLKSFVFMQLESRIPLLEDCARQMLSFGKVESLAELGARIDAVTVSDIDRVARSMLRARPTVTAVGLTTSAPGYDQIAAQFK